VEKLEAYTTALVDMRTTFSSGSFLAKDSSFKAPVISLAP